MNKPPPLLDPDFENTAPAVLLPYQQRWLEDEAPLKLVEKSRRTGLTWAEAADDVLVAAADGAAGGQNVYYIGYNQDMAIEYVEACGMWARHFSVAAGEMEEGFWEDDEADKHIKTFTIRFPGSGHRIVALSSRPANLRGKQGVVVVDEAAFHDQLPELLKAAMALLIWGGKVRIISTHNGEDNAFNELITELRAGKRKGSVQRIEFRDAVEQGLYRRVCLRRGIDWSVAGERNWVDEVYAFYGDDADEELDVVPKAGSGTFLSVVLIERRMAEAPVLRLAYDDAFASRPDHERWGECQAWIDDHLTPLLGALDEQRLHHYGMDFGRSGDLSVIAPLEVAPNLVRVVPFLIEMRNVPFRQQEQVLYHVVDRLPRFVSGAMDARGNGQQMAEYAWQRYGTSRIERVMLTTGWYRENMPAFKAAFEDAAIVLPRDVDVRADLRAIKMDKGVAKIPDTLRQAGSDGKPRHGDSAIALVLGHHASLMDVAPIEFQSTGRRSATDAYDGFRARVHDTGFGTVGGRNDFGGF